MYIPLLLDRSLRYTTALGYYWGVPDAFPVDPTYWNRYINLEQTISLEVRGLKPGTYHRAYLNGIDVTAYCKQEGRNLGDGLISGGAFWWYYTPGAIKFNFYYQSSIDSFSYVGQAAAIAQLLSGQRTLKLQSIDGTSYAEVTLSVPRYVYEEPNVVVKKTPDPTNIASKISYIEVKNAAQDGPYFTPPNYSMIQTFYADSEIVGKSSEVNLTSVDLYFKKKPSQNNNASGNENAGVSVAICEVENGEPVLSKTYSNSLSHKDYSMIYSYADASSATAFGFKEPLKLATGKFYGIVVIFEDPGFELWTNVVGDRLVGTNTPSPGVNSNKDGKLFYRNNSSVNNAMNDTDIKFNIRAAKYVSQSDTKVFVNKNYEFFKINTTSGKFLGGEFVYQKTDPSAGIVSLIQGANTIIGTSTQFDTLPVGTNLVLVSGANSQVVGITEVINSTCISVNSLIEFSNNTGRYISNTVVGQVYKHDPINNKLYLNNSSANSTLYFGVGNTIIGTDSNANTIISSVDNLTIDRVRLRGNIRVPTAGAIDTIYKPTINTASGFVFSEDNKQKIKINNTTAFNVTDYDAYILSRSNEVVEPSGLYSNTSLLINNKSIKVEANYSVIGDGVLYQSPVLENSTLDMYSIQNKVSNTTSHIVNNLDTEITGNGTALSKHITTKVTFSNGRFAEDVRMFMVAYRPKGTEIKVYTRLHNSKDPESFDDKAWTPLEYSTNSSTYSSYDDETNFVEYELGLPQFGESASTLPGTFVTGNGSNSISVANTSVCNPDTYLDVNDVIKIYNPLFPLDNYQVATVTSANSTIIRIGGPIETTNVAGNGLIIDKLKYPTTAFNNINNNNISRYFNSTRAEFDKFDSMQVKIVFLADSTYKVPKIDQIQVLGVSA